MPSRGELRSSGTPMPWHWFYTCCGKIFLRLDPKSDLGRCDRFILSAAMLPINLYSLLHLAGVKAVNRNMKQWRVSTVFRWMICGFSRPATRVSCPTPELVELPELRPNGPLGQGVATSVGIALAISGSLSDTPAELSDVR